MKRRVALSLLVVVPLGQLLTACQSGPSGKSTITSLTVDGVTGIDATAGTADMSVSALDSSGKVVGTGTITVPTATVTSATDGTGGVVTGCSATA